MLIQTYKRLVSRREPEQSVMHAYWGPVEVQMIRSWCSARLSGPRVGPLHIFSCGREVIWVCLFVCLWISIVAPCHDYTYSGVEHSCLSSHCDGGRVSLESDLSFCVCVMCLSCQTGSHDLRSHSSPKFKLFLSSTQVCLNATSPDWYFYPQWSHTVSPSSPLLSVIYLHQ